MSEIYKLARPLLTGVPVLIHIGGGVQEDIKNRMVRDILGGLPAFRGEVVVGDPTAPDCHERSLAFIEDESAVELFVYWVYDLRTTGNYSLKDRLQMAESFVTACGPNTQYADHKLIESPKELEDYIKLVKSRKFTGVVLREPHGTHGTQDETIEFASMQ